MTAAEAAAADTRQQKQECLLLGVSELESHRRLSVYSELEVSLCALQALLSSDLSATCCACLQVADLFKKDSQLGLYSHQARTVVYEPGSPPRVRKVRRSMVLIKKAQLSKELCQKIEESLAEVCGGLLGAHVVLQMIW